MILMDLDSCNPDQIILYSRSCSLLQKFRNIASEAGSALNRLPAPQFQLDLNSNISIGGLFVLQSPLALFHRGMLHAKQTSGLIFFRLDASHDEAFCLEHRLKMPEIFLGMPWV